MFKQEEEEEKEKPVTPWSFVVLIAAVLSHLVGEGFCYGVLGFFTLAQSSHFELDSADSSWTGGILLATSIIFGE